MRGLYMESTEYKMESDLYFNGYEKSVSFYRVLIDRKKEEKQKIIFIFNFPCLSKKIRVIWFILWI